MGFEILIFGILTFLMLTSGIARVYHVKSKKPITEKQQTGLGLFNLFLGTIALYYLLQLSGVI